MFVGHFLKWVETARVEERAAAAGALARAFVQKELPFEERCAAEAALTLLLDDPSARVRAALADALSMSPHAPAQVVAALAADQPEVAGLVIARSPLLGDVDLIDRVAAGSEAIQTLVARRPVVSKGLAAAIAEVAGAKACAALLANPGAALAGLSFRRIAERHGHIPALREALAADPRLPVECRHLLVAKLGETLRQAPLVVALIGADRAARMTKEACANASLSLIEGTPRDEYEALIEHMRLAGDLTSGLLVRALAHGKVDFFGAVLVALSRQSEARVRALLAGGREPALVALLRKAGLPERLDKVVFAALRVWREVAAGRRMAGAQEVSWLMLGALGKRQETSDLAALLKSIHLDALRRNAREHALAIAAA